MDIESLQRLQTVNLLIQKHGPSSPSLLEKAALELSLNNPNLAREAAEQAWIHASTEVAMDEAHYLFALSCAMEVRAGGPMNLLKSALYLHVGGELGAMLKTAYAQMQRGQAPSALDAVEGLLHEVTA